MLRRSTSRSRIRTSGSKSTSRKASSRRARSSTTRNSWRFSPCRSPPRSPGSARGKSPTPRPSQGCSGPKKSSEETGSDSCSSSRLDQPSILRHVPDGVPGLAERFAQEREIVVTVREAWIAVQRSFVRFHRLVVAVQVLQQDAEVVEQQRIAAAGRDCLAINALRVGEAAGFVQEPSQVDAGAQVRRIRFECARIGFQRGPGTAALELASAVEPVLGDPGGAGVVALDHAQGAVGRIAVEGEQILPGFRLPAARAFGDDHAVADRADREARERHGVGEAAAKLFQGFRDPPGRHLRRGKRLRSPQHDQVLEREQVRLARSARGRDETGVDQAADRAAGQAKQPLDVVHAVLVHCGRTGGEYYFFAAFRAAGSGCWARLGALRASASVAFAGAGVFFLSRLARSASMRSMTSAPPWGSSAIVISWPSTFFCTAVSIRARTSSVYAARSDLSEACCSINCCASLSSASFTSVLGISISLIDLTSPA